MSLLGQQPGTGRGPPGGPWCSWGCPGTWCPGTRSGGDGGGVTTHRAQRAVLGLLWGRCVTRTAARFPVSECCPSLVSFSSQLRHIHTAGPAPAAWLWALPTAGCCGEITSPQVVPWLRGLVVPSAPFSCCRAMHGPQLRSSSCPGLAVKRSHTAPVRGLLPAVPPGPALWGALGSVALRARLNTHRCCRGLRGGNGDSFGV